MFNLPDDDLRMYPPLYAQLTLLAVALLVFATIVAVLRLLPANWQFRKSPVSERTWPAFGVTFFILAAWFYQSVMPYRIPGALDYADYPIFQILHVEKRGLQFHETAISVSRRNSFSISGNDRRLFQYRFQQKDANGEMLPALMQRVLAIVHSPDFANRDSTVIRPVRTWNADAWYVRVETSGVHSYTFETATTPPPAIVELFHDLQAAPRFPGTRSSVMKDVCLGFCYDPLSGLGALYSNHRCFNDGHGTHCR